MRVCGACGSRDPRSKYEVRELTTVEVDHWVRVPKLPLQRLKAEPPIRLLRVPAKMEDDKEDEPVEIKVRREEFYNFWEHAGEAYHVVPEAVFVKKDTGVHSIFACGYCDKHWENPATPLVHRSDDASGNGNFDTFDDLYYKASKKGAPVSAIAAGVVYRRSISWISQHLGRVQPVLAIDFEYCKTQLFGLLPRNTTWPCLNIYI
jgi:hypothetical protein